MSCCHCADGRERASEPVCVYNLHIVLIVHVCGDWFAVSVGAGVCAVVEDMQVLS